MFEHSALRLAFQLRVPAAEAEKHGLGPEDAAVLDADPAAPTDLALVLGSDSTILSTLRLFAGREVPMFAINFGLIGFRHATVEPDELELGSGALAGELDVMMEPPALAVATSAGDRLGVNDVSFHRRQDGRVAGLAYSVEGEELGQVRCDGSRRVHPGRVHRLQPRRSGRFWPGGRGLPSSPSSPRTRSPRRRSSWRRRTPSR